MCMWWRVDLVLDGREGLSVKVFAIDDRQAKRFAWEVVENRCPHANEVVFWRVAQV